NALRREQRRAETVACGPLDDHPDPVARSSALERASEEERRDTIRCAVEALPEDLRSVALAIEAGLASRAELAESFGVSLATIERRLKSMRSLLECALGRGGGLETRARLPRRERPARNQEAVYYCYDDGRAIRRAEPREILTYFVSDRS